MTNLSNIQEKKYYGSTGSDATYLSTEGLVLRAEQVNNDVHGNPMFKVKASIAYFSEVSFNNFYLRDDIKEFTTRRYPSKKYVLVQTADIDQEINRIFEKLHSLRQYYYPRS